MKSLFAEKRRTSRFARGSLALLVVLMGGCATWSERASEEGESRFYRAEWDEVMSAIRDEVEDRDLRVRYVDERDGRLTAFSWARTGTTVRDSRQLELRFFLDEGRPGEVEVRLRVGEIEERHLFHDRPVASRKPLRDPAFYRMILDGIERRLQEET